MNKAIVFFHGLDSSNQTNKFTCINHVNKFCITVDYRNNLDEVFNIYDDLINEKLDEYDEVVLVGHSFGGWFANYFAGKYNLKCLLIAPCIFPHKYLNDRVDLTGKYFDFNLNAQKAVALIFKNDEVLEYTDINNFISDKYEFIIIEGGHRACPAELINDIIDELINKPFSVIL